MGVLGISGEYDCRQVDHDPASPYAAGARLERVGGQPGDPGFYLWLGGPGCEEFEQGKSYHLSVREKV